MLRPADREYGWSAVAGTPSSWLWRAYQPLAMGLGLGALAFICLAWLPFALILHPLLPQRLGKRLGRAAIRKGFRVYTSFLETCCGCRFDLDVLQGIGRAGPVVLVANHPSLLDAVLIISRVPNVACIMKGALMDNLLFGAAARLARYIRNTEPAAMILGARQELEEGAVLLIFPEGSRTRDFPLDPCHPTAGLIASRAKVPVQTLFFDFSTPYLGKAWPLFRPPVLPLVVRLRPGPLLPPPAGPVGDFTRELEACLRAGLCLAPEPSHA